MECHQPTQAANDNDEDPFSTSRRLPPIRRSKAPTEFIVSPLSEAGPFQDVSLGRALIWLLWAYRRLQPDPYEILTLISRSCR